MNSLKLNKLNKNLLSNEQMKGVTGGANTCQCGCCYANSGGSSVTDNAWANARHGYTSPCEIKHIIYDRTPPSD